MSQKELTDAFLKDVTPSEYLHQVSVGKSMDACDCRKINKLTNRSMVTSGHKSSYRMKCKLCQKVQMTKY